MALLLLLSRFVSLSLFSPLSRLRRRPKFLLPLCWEFGTDGICCSVCVAKFSRAWRIFIFFNFFDLKALRKEFEDEEEQHEIIQCGKELEEG